MTPIPNIIIIMSVQACEKLIRLKYHNCMIIARAVPINTSVQNILWLYAVI